jgi:hypothetical protein
MRFDEESIRKRIHTLLEAIQTEADPELLDRCRSIFRQEVSFFRRSYMAAYLLLLENQDNPQSRSGHTRHEGRKRSGGEQRGEPVSRRTPEYEARSQEENTRTMIPEEESSRLFISIGRNRKVFPREILGLIDAKTQVSKDDVGLIRILDNYSFVQVRNSAADTIIQALNGQNFRGRTLTVSYARPRREEEDRDESGGETADSVE